MRRVFDIAVLCTAALLASPDALTATADEPRASSTPEIRRVVIDPATGNPRIVELSPLPVKAAGAAPTDRAMALLQRHADLLGLDDPAAELVVDTVRSDPLGGQQVVFTQTHHGVSVFGALLRVHFDGQGSPTLINGAVVSDIDLDLVPTIDAHQAEASAVRVVAKLNGGDHGSFEVTPARLVVYRTNLVRGLPGANHLAWEVEAASLPKVHEILYFDAQDGRLLDHRSAIHELDRAIHAGRYPNPIWREGDDLPYSGGNAARDEEINELITATGDAHALFANLTGGDYLGFDGLDATMNAVYDADYIDCPNAVESGGTTAFCEGMVSDDVAAHEWAHAYTEWTHNLIYQWQPGALNEAYSDIFGELVDLLNERGTDHPNQAREFGVCSSSGGSPRPALEIVSPGAIAGPVPAGGAVFNPLAPWQVTGAVVLVDDGIGVATDACEAVNDLPSGAIALIDRGSCFFRDKVLGARAAGAAAAIIVNNQGDDVIEMGGDLPRLDIPAVFVGAADGDRIKGALADGVTATLDLDGEFTESVRWLIGEDASAIGAMRDMWTPSCFGDPPRVGSIHYHCNSTDNGGVHTNSGVANHAFALLVDGGVYNGRRIEAIGATRAARIYWRAMSQYQTPVSDFEDHADVLELACNDLVGQVLYDLRTGNVSPEVVTPATCLQVAAAMDAVEMRVDPVQCRFSTILDPDAPAVEANVVAFSDDFESDPAGAWTLRNGGIFPEYDSRDWQWTDELPDLRDGSAFFAVNSVLIGDCVPGSDDQSGMMELESPVIDIPLGIVEPILVFDHWVATEAEWDGGNVKISVNGGPYLEIQPSRFLFNAYNGRITSGNSTSGTNPNPLRGQWGFTGTDFGSVDGSWGQSQVRLDGIVAPGDRLRIRFDFGVDGCNGVQGWYVDNVEVRATSFAPRSAGRRVAP